MVTFHRVLIATAIVFCAGFALWAFGHYVVVPRTPTLLLALTFAVFAAALSYYLANLKRFLGR